jgi:ATP-binding cassette, subfamily B (MDR/TAP), member 1
VNVHGIQPMVYEDVFERQFELVMDKALSMGVCGALVEDCTFGVASGLIYATEALLFYVSVLLIVQGTYMYLQMVEVLNLVVFTSIGSQLMAFSKVPPSCFVASYTYRYSFIAQYIAKSVQAMSDFNRLLKLETNAEVSRGIMRPEFKGLITFNHVGFSYPERGNPHVLKDIILQIAEGKCVAVVGPSGAGKSTVAALLQRLYQPDSGSISIGANDIASTDITHLRYHISIVSQNPNLFDTTIPKNIW